jgi:hypothetical protein
MTLKLVGSWFTQWHFINYSGYRTMNEKQHDDYERQVGNAIEVVIVYFNVLTQDLSGGTEETELE